MRDIKIEMVSNGYIVRVGCKSFVYHESHIEVMLTDVRHYMKDPVVFEKKFLASCENEAKMQKYQEMLSVTAPSVRNTTSSQEFNPMTACSPLASPEPLAGVNR